MLELLKDILLSPFGSFASVFALFIGFFVLVFKAGKIVEKFGLVNKMEESIGKIKEDISEIKAFIQLFRQENNPLAKAKSPISLTELGLEVAKELHIERIINSNWESLYKKIKSKLKNDDNPYNIQEVCFEIGEKYTEIVSDSELDIIKKYAYKKGYSLANFDLVFGVLIRDKFFETEAIDVADVDIHDPEKNK